MAAAPYSSEACRHVLGSQSLEELFGYLQDRQRDLWKEAEGLQIAWKREVVTEGLTRLHFRGSLFGRMQNINAVEYEQEKNPKLTLLISKISEAMSPKMAGRHRGPGAPLADVPSLQPGIRFMINGGYSHYRHNYYPWPTSFEIGDPVGLTIIRDHQWVSVTAAADLKRFGFFVQTQSGFPFAILNYDQVQAVLHAKYILSCSPLLIEDDQYVSLKQMRAYPLWPGEVNPPGHLGHVFHPNPRTAVGIRSNGDLVFVTVDGRSVGGSSGMEIAELTALMRTLQARTALNLDGGGSTQTHLAISGRQVSIVNHVDPEDSRRDIGNALIIFDESLKPEEGWVLLKQIPT